MRLTPMNSLRSILFLAAVAAALILAAVPGFAQRAAPAGSGDSFKDTSMFKPPAGARVAVVEFEDLECPACAAAFPVVHQAVAHYNIPLVRHDFPLGGMHIWSSDAAIWARYLQDKVSPKTAEEYRGAVFAAQASIASKDDMLSFTRRFFQQHGLQMPFVPDPSGYLASEVKTDRAIGERMGLQHTPTVIVCSQKEWVQVADMKLLYQTIDQVMANAGSLPAQKATPVKKALPAKKAGN